MALYVGNQESGAGTKSRTRDLLITNQLLYQLSYTGIHLTRGASLGLSNCWRNIALTN